MKTEPTKETKTDKALPAGAAKETKIEKPLPKGPVKKFKIDFVNPADIVDVWRLYEQSLKLAPPKYPDMSEENLPVVRAHVFNMISQPNFVGVIVKSGKRPIAQVNGFISQRPFGSPKYFFQFWLFWVDPEFRGSDLGRQMLQQVFAKLKADGIHHFESITEPELVQVFTKWYKGKVDLVSHRLAGKITLEQ